MANSTQTFFFRLVGTSWGHRVPAASRAKARVLFADHMDLNPKNSYIVVSDTPAQGVFFTDLPTE